MEVVHHQYAYHEVDQQFHYDNYYERDTNVDSAHAPE